MPKRRKGSGNPYRKPARSSDGGQYTTGPGGIVFRSIPLSDDMASILKNPNIGKKDFAYQMDRKKVINTALYNGGYTATIDYDLRGFTSADDAENFLSEITTNTSARDIWLEHRDFVEMYLGVTRGYMSKDIFSEPRDGVSQDGSARDSTSLIREFNLSRKDIREIIMGLTADDFVNSGKNVTTSAGHEGTVVMVFAPRCEFRKIVEEDGRLVEKKETVDMYIKLCLNPHPPRHETEMSVISFKEATKRTCLYTGEERRARK